MTNVGNPPSFADLQQVIDRIAITELLDRYAKLFDDRTFTTTSPMLFTKDAHVVLPPGDHEGLDGMDAFFECTLAPFGRTQHIFANYIIDITNDDAVIRANGHVTHVLPRADPTDEKDKLFVVGLVVTGTVIRTSDGWRFKQVALDVVWRQGDFGPVVDSGLSD